jgi:chromosomal replication initiation ATPase DnaA
MQPARTTSRHELVALGAGAQAPAASSEWSTLWSAAKQLLAERLPAPEFAAWFDITDLVSYDEGQAIIGVPHIFARDTLSSTYQPLIAEVLQTLTSAAVTVEVVIA